MAILGWTLEGEVHGNMGLEMMQTLPSIYFPSRRQSLPVDAVVEAEAAGCAVLDAGRTRRWKVKCAAVRN